ncbi:MAG TPA: hypothetical protein VFN49_08265 [Candidatus Aquilonibacter sp.]|nr:hypothetical protein [Candidatus Aquilonibacter sp.]
MAVVQNKTIQAGHWGQSIIGSLPFAGAVVYEQLSPKVRRAAVVDGTAFYFDGVESGEHTLVISYGSFVSKIVLRVKPGTLLVRNVDANELYRTIGVEYGQPPHVVPVLIGGKVSANGGRRKMSVADSPATGYTSAQLAGSSKKSRVRYAACWQLCRR